MDSINGSSVLRVRNHTGTADEAAATVMLPAGEYEVLANAEGYGRVSIRVWISAHALTQVDLGRSGMPNVSSVATDDLVHLPQGQAIGWRARPAPESSR